MKKVLIVIGVVLVLLIGCVAVMGGGSDESTSSDSSGNSGNDKSISVESKEDVSTANDDVTVEEQVLLDQDGVVVTLKGMDTKGFWGPEFKVETVNNSDKTVVVQTRDMSINGVMIDPAFSANVAPGKTSNDQMSVFSSSLKNAGIETIQNAEFKINVSDGDSYETMLTSDVISVDTSAAGTFEQEYNDNGTEVYKDDMVRIVAQKLDSEDSFWGADIYLYIENNSDKTITVQSRDTSVNGVMMDPSFSATITPGKKSFSTLTFFESDMESNGIESIDELETSFAVIDESSLDTITKTDPVTVSFN